MIRDRLPEYPLLQPPQRNTELYVFGVYSRILDRISHFLLLQMKFRSIGMTALFGVIGAVGFFISSRTVHLSFDSRWAVIATCLVGVLLTTVCGLIDLVFYERLLLGNLIEAVNIERQFNWIPPTHLLLLDKQMHYRDPIRKSVFYISIVSVFIMISLSIFISMGYFWGSTSLILPFILGGVFIAVYSIAFGRTVTKFSHLTELIHDSGRGSDY